MKAVEATGLCKAYGPVKALNNVSFSVEKGEILGLLGPNGAGKTTLMKILTGYLQADEGGARVLGDDVAANALAVQRKIGYLPENAPVYREETVQEYLLMMADLREIEPARVGRMIADAIEATGLGNHLDRPIGALSKGYRQRVGLAQALLHRPELLILDEPTTGLDPTQIAEIRTLVRELSRDATIMLSTHILSEVELTCERVLMISQGEVKADARMSELRKENAAIVAIADDATGVEAHLSGIDGVSQVESLGSDDGFRRWRVTGADDVSLCPQLFDALRDTSWKVAELKADTRSLETVFSDIVRGQEATR